MKSRARARSAIEALVVATFAVCAAAIAAACAPPPARGPSTIGEPVPTATTSAEPLWLRNRP